MLVFLGGILLLLGASIQAGVRRDDVSDAPFLDLAASDLYQSVGRLNFSVGSSSYLASGVLISPDWVLTAGHVVGGNDYQGVGINQLTFSLTTGGSVLSFAASAWYAHPGWTITQGDMLAGFDLGLIHLQSSVSAIQAASLYLSESLQIQTGTMVGYGATGTGITGFQAGTAGVKRAGQNMIDAQGDGATISSSILFVDFDQPGTDANNVVGGDVPLSLEYLIAPGDSGGGLFVTENQQTFLVGISSFTWGILDGTANSNYGDVAGFTSTTSQLAWIHAMTGVPIPEPSTSALLWVGLATWFRMRRKKDQGAALGLR